MTFSIIIPAYNAEDYLSRCLESIFSQEFEDYMSTKGYEPAYGARPIKRLMQKELVNLLAKSILDGHVHRDSEILVDVRDGQIAISEA
jgi:ATP-dependent Clp protease ATP-binding subunit ClpB